MGSRTHTHTEFSPFSDFSEATVAIYESIKPFFFFISSHVSGTGIAASQECGELQSGRGCLAAEWAAGSVGACKLVIIMKVFTASGELCSFFSFFFPNAISVLRHYDSAAASVVTTRGSLAQSEGPQGSEKRQTISLLTSPLEITSYFCLFVCFT